jgi:hypothetical protein
MQFYLRKFGVLTALTVLMAVFASAQAPEKYKSQEISETDGIPVLVKHLPDWESHTDSTVFASKPGELEAAIGQRPIFGQIDFTAGTEAVSAKYPAGRLVIVEYTSPQASSEADAVFSGAVDSSMAYRRIGNYNAFVLDVTDKAAANELLDQVKYEKNIQWLGNNPFRISPERAFAITTADIFMSTLIVILIGIGLSIIGGIAAGFVFFAARERHRRSLPTFSDAGGMIRLNLDGLTPDIGSDRLLSD